MEEVRGAPCLQLEGTYNQIMYKVARGHRQHSGGFWRGAVQSVLDHCRVQQD